MDYKRTIHVAKVTRDYIVSMDIHRLSADCPCSYPMGKVTGDYIVSMDIHGLSADCPCSYPMEELDTMGHPWTVPVM